MNAIDFFLLAHARAHTGALLVEEPGALTPHLISSASPHHAWDRQSDILLDGFSDAQLRYCPEDMNSLAWLIWHMARSEDMKLALLTGQPQVFDNTRLGAGPRDIGTAMSRAQVEALSATVDLGALRAYWIAVGRQTRAGVQALRGSTLEQVYDEDAILERLRADEMLTPSVVTWEKDQAFFRGRTTAWMLSQLICHNSIHIGEGFVTAQAVRRHTVVSQMPGPALPGAG